MGEDDVPPFQQFRWRVAAALFAAGVALIVGGAFTDGYAATLLVELGVAFFLVVPLLLAEQALSRQVREVKQASDDQIADLHSELGEVRTSISAVSEELAKIADRTSRAVAERRAEEEAATVAPARAVAANPSRTAVAAALAAARNSEAIRSWRTSRSTGWGLHMAFPARGYLATVGMTLLDPVLAESASDRVPTLEVEFTFPDLSMPEVPRIEWKLYWDDPQKFFEHVDAELRALLGAGRAPDITPDVLLGGLAASLEAALRRRKEFGRNRPWCLIGAAGPWIVSTDGLEHDERGLVIDYATLLSAESGAFPLLPADAPDRDLVADLWPTLGVWIDASDRGAEPWRGAGEQQRRHL